MVAENDFSEKYRGHITSTGRGTLSGEDLILTWKITFLFTAHWTLLHSGSGAQEGVECRGMRAQDIKGTLGDCST